MLPVLLKSLHCLMKELQHFFITFSYNFDMSLKSIKKRITPQLQDPLSRAFYKYWQLLIFILVDLERVYQSITSKRSDKKWLTFQEGWWEPPPPPPPPLARYVSRNCLTIGGLMLKFSKFQLPALNSFCAVLRKQLEGKFPPPPPIQNGVNFLHVKFTW